MRVLVYFLLFVFLYGCSTKEANTIPYKYRTKERVEMECKAEIEKNKASKARASSNAGNFALGFMEALMEDWACDPYR